MEKRVTIYDIADKLNISTTTVFRALNGKARVSGETKKLVEDTAREMGFKVNKVAKGLARNTIKLGLIVSWSIPEFNNEIIRGAHAAYEELSDFNVAFKCYTTKQSPHNQRQEILDKIDDMASDGYNGILILPCADMRGFHEKIQELSTNGIAVASVVSSILGSKSIFSLRQNALLSGGIASELLWWFTANKNIAIFTGYQGAGIHPEVIEGFYDGCKSKALNIIGIYENHDDPELAYYTTGKVLDEHPELEGIYICSANSVTVCKRLKEKGYAGRIKVVASDIFPELKDYMMEDVIHASIFQDPFNQGRLALKYMYQHIAEGKLFDKDILIKPQIILKSNIETFI
jgi:ABC-type sugar transport system, periplasmic component